MFRCVTNEGPAGILDSIQLMHVLVVGLYSYSIPCSVRVNLTQMRSASNPAYDGLRKETSG